MFDKAFFGPLKAAFATEADKYMLISQEELCMRDNLLV
jgi:hypothetical protein